MITIFNDISAHEKINELENEIEKKCFTKSMQKKLQYLVDKGHYYVDELEDISSKLQNMTGENKNAGIKKEGD